MKFDFNAYSTPLLFGFVQAWLFALLFWRRAWKQERLSDALFGCLMMALSFEIWEYMLGFAGIGILWTTLEFLPRTLGFLLPPLAYFYLKSQFNSDFRFRSADIWHTLPFAVHTVYHVMVYVQGAVFVEYWKMEVHEKWGINYLEMLVSWTQQLLYFIWSYRLYQAYRQWVPTHFSNVETLSFGWFRTFLFVFLIGNVVSWAMSLIDLWLHLDFWHNWWDELISVVLIYYLGIEGLTQSQPLRLRFTVQEDAPAPSSEIPARPEKISEADLADYQARLVAFMERDRLYLDPELSLSQLARHLDTNVSVLSAVINRAFGRNFNDFVNEYRVRAVQEYLQNASASHLSLLGIGLECGFNSKSTFNRAFRKVTGVAPSEWATDKGGPGA
jgi:AraC-like DNA-binding protein